MSSSNVRNPSTSPAQNESLKIEIVEKQEELRKLKKDLGDLKKQLKELTMGYQADITKVLSQLTAQVSSTHPTPPSGIHQASMRACAAEDTAEASPQKRHTKASLIHKNPQEWNCWSNDPELRNLCSREEWKLPSKEDLETVTKQLGRPPKGIWEVSSRCPSGHPQTLRVHPLKKITTARGGGRGDKPKIIPHPTHYWLTCPKIVAQIGDIERKDGCVRAKNWLLQDEERTRDYKRNHLEYAADRWHSMSKKEAEETENMPPAILRRIKWSGIGGSAWWDNCKCLHQIYAHHLVRKNNIIGRWIDDNFDVCACAKKD
mmetsp:Transcript_14553/g.23128  ORF Transcript_14553/g.23128 Transcript_14553/m.23128 type:complete len:317 (+) Transcript_14553:43-993(+)